MDFIGALSPVANLLSMVKSIAKDSRKDSNKEIEANKHSESDQNKSK